MLQYRHQKKIEDGENDYKVLWSTLAAEYGYEITDEELEEMYKAATAEMSEEELGKVAGGTATALVFSGMSIIITTSVVTIIKDALDD